MVFNFFRNLQSSTSLANTEKLHPSLFPSHSLLFGYEVKKSQLPISSQRLPIANIENKSQMPKAQSLINLKNKQGINELEWAWKPAPGLELLGQVGINTWLLYSYISF